MVVGLPSIIQTPNGNVAALMWQDNIDPEIVRAINDGHNLLHHSTVGYADTPYGNLAYLLIILGTEEEFSNLDSKLFFFNVSIAPPFLKQDSILKRWLRYIQKQDELRLEIQYRADRVHSIVVLRRAQLREYIAFLNQSLQEWKSTNNEQLASRFAASQTDNIAPQVVTEVLNKHHAIKQASPDDQLLFAFTQSSISRLGGTHPVAQMAMQQDLDGVRRFLEQQQVPPIGANRNEWLSVINDDNELENLVKDWIFALTCLESSSLNRLKIAVGLSDSGGWAWQPLPGKHHIKMLWFHSRAYRALLKSRHWKHLLTNSDITTPELDEKTIAALGKVPDRAAFKEVSKILRLALLEREFGISTKSTIIVGIPGFESVTFYPIDRDSRQCLFKVTMLKNQRGVNFCLFGILDSALGAIEPVGVTITPVNEKVLRLLLFLVAIAYRDLIVARHVLTGEPNKKQGEQNQKKCNKAKESLITLARVKKRNPLSEHFADPDRIIQTIKRYVNFRVEHPRQLPHGWKPSQKQLELAEKFNWILPEGFTFVSPVLKGQTDKGIVEAQELERKFRSLSLLQILCQ